MEKIIHPKIENKSISFQMPSHYKKKHHESICSLLASFLCPKPYFTMYQKKNEIEMK